MLSARHAFLVAALVVPRATWAQETAPAPPDPSAYGLTVRLGGGPTALALGEAAAFHQSVAEAYAEAGVPVPTQRSYPAAPAAGLDVMWSPGRGRHFGGGVRYAASSAYSLYGDYAGTLDLVSRVRAVFVETVSIAEFNSGGRLRPYLGSRGGTVYATSRTDEALDLGEFGESKGSVVGSGVGYSVEGFGGVTASARAAGLFVQGGYRYARVPRLDGEASANGMTEEGRLPYGLALSGWSLSAGITVPLRF